MDGRMQEHLQRALRYSVFVGHMRRALPLVAALMLLLLFAWPSLKQDPRDLPQTGSDLREMINLRYSGLNNKGEPMSVTATRATQSGTMESEVNLENVTGELARSNNGWVRLASKTGVYDQKANRVRLTGEVHLTDHTGYDVVTDSADIDLNKPAQAWGDKPVTGKGPQGNIKANGFRITDEGKTVMFTGRTRLVLPQGKK